MSALTCIFSADNHISPNHINNKEPISTLRDKITFRPHLWYIYTYFTSLRFTILTIKVRDESHEFPVWHNHLNLFIMFLTPSICSYRVVFTTNASTHILHLAALLYLPIIQLKLSPSEIAWSIDQFLAHIRPPFPCLCRHHGNDFIYAQRSKLSFINLKFTLVGHMGRIEHYCIQSYIRYTVLLKNWINSISSAEACCKLLTHRGHSTILR